MVATIALVAMMLSLSAAALLMATSDIQMFRNLRDGTAAYYATRGAAIRAMARLPAGYAFDSILAGPDGTPGTGDDGMLPDGPPTCLLRVADDAADPEPAAHRDGNQRVRVAAECTGHRNARRDVEIIVGREPKPFVPAALYLDRPDTDITAPTLLDGNDHAPGDRPGAASGTGPAVLEAASPDLDAPVRFPAAVHNGHGDPVGLFPALDMDAPAFAARALALGPPLIPALPPGQIAGLFTHAAGDASVSGPTRGAGLLLIDGDFRVDAPLDFSGVVVISGRLRVSATGMLSIRGFLWVRGEGPGPALVANGPLTVLYSRNAVADADATFSLPRRAVPRAERQVF
jgi:hypothetical protein